jgi:hypothetical protein
MPAVVTAAGGQALLSPGPLDTWVLQPPGNEVQALDLGNGHLTWQVPAPPSTRGLGHDWSVIPTDQGQPVVVLQDDEEPVAKGGTMAVAARLVAYGSTGAVRWRLPAHDQTFYAAGDQLFVAGPGSDSGRTTLTARKLADLSTAWSVTTAPDPTDGATATATQLFLPTGGPDGRSSLLIDRRTGAATPVLAHGLPTEHYTSWIAPGGRTLIVGAMPDPQSETVVVGYPLR